jgi:hypothetical protein
MMAVGVAQVISKNPRLEVPPPGAGFMTVTKAVLGSVRADAGTAAFKLSPLTKVVGSG